MKEVDLTLKIKPEGSCKWDEVSLGESLKKRLKRQ